jgi:ribosomal-protein-alanine N-acetyltransferase
MNPSITIRKMDVDDVNEVISIAATSTLNPWSRNMFLEEIAHPHSGCFLIDIEEERRTAFPAGFICFRHIGEESELFNVCVHPRYRRKGLGRRLMAFYIDFCGQKGVKKIFLEVSPLNLPAIRLYHSFAFQEAGRRKGFYQGNHEAILMER